MDVDVSDIYVTRRGKKSVAINKYKFSKFRENNDTTKNISYKNRYTN
jgi:hypothetical protein